MIVLRTDRKHASNCMTEENGVEKVKKRKNFFRSLRFRILIILIILGIVPGVIVTYTMLHNYQNRAVAMLTETVGDQCDILCNLIIRENYLNDTDSEIVNSKLELFSNVYNGRILLAAAPTAPPCFRHWRRSSLLHFFLVSPICCFAAGVTSLLTVKFC